jgi:hypothetical protein
MPGGFKQSRTQPGFKYLNLPLKTDFCKIQCPQLVGEQEPSCYYQLWNSRKIFKKVTNVLFPNEISRIPAPALRNCNLFATVNKVQRDFFPCVREYLSCRAFR